MKLEKKTIDEWISDPSLFWRSESWTGRFEDVKLADIYNSYLSLEVQQSIHVLRLRLLILFFYDLHSCLIRERGFRAGAAYKVVATIISSGHVCEVSVEKIIDLVARGRRYNKLTETFGNKVLLQLPVQITRDESVLYS